LEESDDKIILGVAVVILNRRRELGLSQADLAQSAGLHRTYISDIERGQRNLTLKTLVRLSSALAMSASEFMRLVEKEQTKLIGRETNKS
jgi:transcriptional regulator with XRE-family HTH domain